LLQQDGLLAAPVKPELLGDLRYDLTPKKPHFEAQAKAMISLFMMGGPSQMDLFDPKPMLTKYDGQKFPGEIKYDNLAQASSKCFGSPWKFAKHGQCGMEISELLPHLSKVVDEITFVRSMTSGVNESRPGALRHEWRPNRRRTPRARFLAYLRTGQRNRRAAGLHGALASRWAADVSRGALHQRLAARSFKGHWCGPPSRGF